jgi:uncharacterized protein (TIGR02246 family)
MKSASDNATVRAFRFQQELLSHTPSRGSLAERITHLEAEREIRDVLDAYSVHYDAGDVDAVSELFAEDAVLRNLLGEHIGREAIKENYAFMTSHLAQSMHFITNVTVRVDSPDSARAASYLHSIATRRRDGYTYGTGGTYSDRLVRRDGRWQIIEREVSGYIPYDLEATPAHYDRFAPDSAGS